MSRLEQSKRTLFESTVRKQLCQVEQDAHRAVINNLKQLEKRLGLRQTKVFKLDRIKVYNVDHVFEAIQNEIAWRKDQIAILEMDRAAAHKSVKWHTNRLVVLEARRQVYGERVLG
jgi:hypothetical protein